MIAMVLNPGTKRRRRKSRGRRRGKKVCFTVRRRARGSRRRRSTRRRARRIKKGSSAWHARKAEAYVKKVARDARSAARRASMYDYSSPFARRTAANGRGRRSRRVSYRYRRARGKARNGSTWIPQFKNPGSIVSGATQAFNVKTLSDTLPTIAGFIGNKYVSNFLASLSFVPSMLKTGPGRSALEVLSAGVLSAGVGLISKKHAGDALLGGVIQAMTGVAQKYVMPMVGLSPMGYLTVADARDARMLDGMDYFTAADAKNLVPLNGMDDDMDGLDDDGEMDGMDGSDVDAEEIGN